MIKAIALDDEPPALAVIKRFSEQASYLELVKTFTKAEEAMKFIGNFPVDLLFLDIHMPAISGIDFKKQLDPHTMVIFTTAYSEYALEGFNLNAVDYLLKPFTAERFLQATEKAKAFYQYQHQNTANKPDHILIRVDYSLQKIMLADILFIEGLDDYLKIHLKDQKPVVARMTLKAIAEKLPQTDFIRVHRSYIISLSKIASVRNKVITIGEEVIPLGASFEEKFYEILGKQIN
ncbi:MAG: LytTR family DNA-binding domain-containing protein [Chitinophagaceae bacterium]